MSVSKFLRQASAAVLALTASASVLANPVPWQLNLTPGVTSESREIYALHMAAFWVCVGIGVVVFGAMIIAMFRFRKSRGAVPANWSHNTKLEFLWTLVPVLILIGLATPATRILMNEYDTTGSDMTIKVTGYQWMWKYEYLGEGVEYTSRLARRSDDLRQSGGIVDAAQDPNYLLEVDHPLVLPVGTKVRFVVTADDVIHAWWVPALGWKQDAIPGIINSTWTEIPTPGVYRGQCAELCGKDHGFMPVVVKAVPKAEFARWLAAEKAKNAPPPAPAAMPAPATPAPAQPEPAAATAATTPAPAPSPAG